LTSFRTTRIRTHALSLLVLPSRYAGLISQVAEEIWEVKGKKIINLSKEGMTIVDYKVRSQALSLLLPSSSHASLTLPFPLPPSFPQNMLAKRSQEQIAKAKLSGKKN